MGARWLTMQELEKILTLAELGLRVTDIGKTLDRSTTAISKALMSYGVPTRPASRTPEQMTEALALHHNGIRPPQPGTYAAQPVIAPADPSYLDRLRRWAGGDKATEREPDPVDTPACQSICADCGEMFSLSSEHVGWFAARGLATPRRCESCRSARKVQPVGSGDPETELAALQASVATLVTQVALLCRIVESSPCMRGDEL